MEVGETAIGGYDPKSQVQSKSDKKLVVLALEITKKSGFGRAYAQTITTIRLPNSRSCSADISVGKPA
jgi:hypothetical protein